MDSTIDSFKIMRVDVMSFVIDVIGFVAIFGILQCSVQIPLLLHSMYRECEPERENRSFEGFVNWFFDRKVWRIWFY